MTQKEREAIRRPAARAILLTPERETLLLRLMLRGEALWITPGGGIEPGETAEAALQRELGEELGLGAAGLGPLLWRRAHHLTLGGQRWCQDESYFLIETPRFDPVMQDRAEARMVREFRWWRLDELAATEARVIPQALFRILSDYLSYGPPERLPPREIVRD